MEVLVMQEVLRGSEQGIKTFPEVVGSLIGAGVESYTADLVRHEYIYYMPNGETQTEPGTLPVPPIAESFSAQGLVTAIRGAQADRVRYPEFIRLSAAAGVVAYRVFLTGKRAVYFGRKGEIHVEEFPKAKS